MSIEWMTKAKLEEWGKQAFPPIGLWLRPFLDGRLAEGCDLGAAVGRAPEEDDWAPGLGGTDGWVGLCAGVPFVLLGQTVDGTDRWGFNLSLPARVRDGGDGVVELDVEPLLTIARALAPVLRRNERPYVDGLPFPGRGWGVVAENDTFPLFRAPSRESAEVVAGFFNDGGLGRYELVGVEASPPQWIVAGPRVGPYLSRLGVCATSDEAARTAARWGDDLGVSFTVHRVG